MTPYFRIIRPVWKGHYGNDHFLDYKYCNERQNLIHAYHIIQNDFKKLYDYVELHEANKSTFSHRIFELFLRTCTEFENNCTGILKDNGYTKKGNLTIKDYFKINEASRLNEYEIKINIWSPTPLIFKPFEQWKTSQFEPLSWYQDYNLVKHDRTQYFHLASLDNLIKGIGGLFVIVVSQFYSHAFHQFQENMSTSVDDDGFRATQDSIFAIKVPQSWQESEYYKLDTLTRPANEGSINPFRKYPFK